MKIIPKLSKAFDRLASNGNLAKEAAFMSFIFNASVAGATHTAAIATHAGMFGLMVGSLEAGLATLCLIAVHKLGTCQSTAEKLRPYKQPIVFGP